ncbi:MAG: N-acetylmuramoyl-L-alanine amidase [Elusimicrobia bacterium]|nr:N-acetylmuramoyl-L-alanine amidase [Elusimicrobiota bacterium]
MTRTLIAAVLLCSGMAASVAAMTGGAPLPLPADRPVTPVILDPGHGGDDLGAVAQGLQEKDIALAVALKLRDKIKGDMPVALTRDSDHYVTLDQRLVESVDWNGAVFVSIHLNKVRNKKLSGAVVYSFAVQKRGAWHRRRHHPKVPPMPAPPGVEAKESAYLAGSLVKAMRADGFRVEPAKSDYYVLKNPAQPSILIEIGYLSNPEEAARLNDPAYQDKLASSMAAAIKAYANNRSLRAETATTYAAAPVLAHL